MEKLKKLLMQNKFFPVLTALLCAAVFAGGHMFVPTASACSMRSPRQR